MTRDPGNRPNAKQIKSLNHLLILNAKFMVHPGATLAIEEVEFWARRGVKIILWVLNRAN